MQLVHELLVDPDFFLPAGGLACEIGVSELEVGSGDLQATGFLGDLPNAFLKCDLVILYPLGGLIKSVLVDNHEIIIGIDVHIVLLLELDTRLKDTVEEFLEKLDDFLGRGAGSEVLRDLDEHTDHRC